jgi:hypothetical protein
MKVPEFVEKVKRLPNFDSEKSMGERKELSALLRQALAIIEADGKALEEIAQRANERHGSEMAERETVYDIHGIARRALKKEV